MGLIEKVLAAIAVIAAGVALWFRSRLNAAQTRIAEIQLARARARADRARVALAAKERARQALAEKRAEQAKKQQPPDTAHRDDLESGW